MVVEVADPYKPTSHWKHKISTAIGSPAGEPDWRSPDGGIVSLTLKVISKSE